MSTGEKRRSDVARRDVSKLLGAAGAAARTLPMGGSASADEIMNVAADNAHNHELVVAGSNSEGSGMKSIILAFVAAILIAAGHVSPAL